MTSNQALQLIAYIPTDKIRHVDQFQYAQIAARARKGIKPDIKESKFLNEVYRYTSGDGDRQDQPFKQYRKPKSRGI